jgi:hypothetical protein
VSFEVLLQSNYKEANDSTGFFLTSGMGISVEFGEKHKEYFLNGGNSLNFDRCLNSSGKGIFQNMLNCTLCSSHWM